MAIRRRNAEYPRELSSSCGLISLLPAVVHQSFSLGEVARTAVANTLDLGSFVFYLKRVPASSFILAPLARPLPSAAHRPWGKLAQLGLEGEQLEPIRRIA